MYAKRIFSTGKDKMPPTEVHHLPLSYKHNKQAPAATPNHPNGGRTMEMIKMGFTTGTRTINPVLTGIQSLGGFTGEFEVMDSGIIVQRPSEPKSSFITIPQRKEILTAQYNPSRSTEQNLRDNLMGIQKIVPTSHVQIVFA
jgi:hypothetical protein